MIKSLPLIITFSFWTSITYCQKVDTLYYTFNFKEASPKKYVFYRIVRYDSSLVKVFDYWKNGDIYMSGGFKSVDFKEKTGPFNYYSNNRISRVMLYEPSKYPKVLNSYKSILEKIPLQPDSLYLVIYFYKNKRFKSAGFRSECCTRYGSWIFLSKNGKQATLESYKDGILNGPLEIYYLNELYLLGSYKNGKKDGAWSYYINHKLVISQTFSEGKKIKVLH